MRRPPFIQVLRITEDGLEEKLIVNLDHVACITPINRKLGGTRLHFPRQALDADRVKRWEAEAALPIVISITMPWAEMVETLKKMKEMP